MRGVKSLKSYRYLSSIEKQEFDMPTDNRLIEWAKENGFTLCPAEEKLLVNVGLMREFHPHKKE